MQIIVASLMIVATAYITRHYLRTFIITQSQEQLTDSLSFIIRTFQDERYTVDQWCEKLLERAQTRFTLMKLDGTPICDNHFPDREIDNHADRPEFIEALNDGLGFSSRKSANSLIQLLYGAVLVRHEDSGEPWFVIRQAFPLERLTSAMKALDRSIIIFVFPLLILTSLFSLYGSLQVSSPLRSLLSKIEHMKKVRRRNRGIDENSLETSSDDDEWMLLEKTLDRAKLDLENYLNELYLENEKINTLMESISDSILAINHNEMILFANGQFKKNFVPLEHKKLDLSDFKVWEILRESEIQELTKEVIHTKEPQKIRNIPLEIKGGKARAYFDITVSPIRDYDEHVYGAVCVFHNVTDRKTAEQLREDFVTNVSHEVRTPLTALKGYVQVLRATLTDREMGPEAGQCLERIETNADRLTLLFNDILNLSVIESKRKVQKIELDTQDITSQVIANVRQTYPKKSLTITTDYRSERVYANAALLEQVLTNLLDNAFKYTPGNGSIHIEWSLEPYYYVLTVKDSGEKIPKEHHPRLFERFYRVDPSRSREQGGTGLGLAIVKHIVQKHYGTISVGHNQDRGNFFCVKFPIKEKFNA